ncbi:MAG: hypothetical protein KDK76_00995, partial [Chlamydiia bacterium]|nr:hypothetical protein [Chlamydiia bacterium]
MGEEIEGFVLRKKTLIWFTSLFALLLAFGIGHRPLIGFGASSYLSTHLPKGGGVNFSYDRAYFKEGQLILSNVFVSQREKGKDPTFAMKVDHLKVAFKYQFFPFQFSSKVVIDHPQVTLAVGKLGEAKKKKGLYKTLDKLFFKTLLTVKEGEFIFGNQVAEVSFESPEEGKNGFLKVSKGKEDPPFFATFS